MIFFPQKYFSVLPKGREYSHAITLFFIAVYFDRFGNTKEKIIASFLSIYFFLFFVE